jgi:predicted ester cyclase
MSDSMNNTNRKIAESFFTLFNSKDASEWTKNLAAGFSADYPGASGLNAEQARMFNVGFLPAFPDLHFDICRTITNGNTFICEWTATGTNDGPLTTPAGQAIPPTGKRGHVDGVLISEVRDGKIVRERTYWDQLQLLGALGLIPN